MLKKMPIIPPRFVDGVEKLHAQLHDAYSKAQKLFGSVLGTSSVPKGGSLHSKSIRILVDFNETQPEDKLTGYCLAGQSQDFSQLHSTWPYCFRFIIMEEGIYLHVPASHTIKY